ncbi:uncharacterized protein [Spinacia oleracea]|uniref:Uncharacterized protein n=1 Tax=Spinacia oleracea TaxID=3562 RepID=A0ABM3QQJ3_SPIOL|nr:uncharacterized protein LOC130461533 [Spinacia oleracea]
MARNGDESDEETPEKDKDYDALNKKDQGEPEDIANDEYLRRLDEFEELADAAALLGVDTNHPTEESGSKKGKGRGRGSGKARGPTKGLGKTGPMFLQFDSLLRPSGKWRLKYGQQIGLCSRKLNINWDWPSVSQGLRSKLWEDTMARFHLEDDPVIKKNFLSSVAKRFRDFKGKLVSGHIIFTRKLSKNEVNRQPYEIWKNIQREDWETFIKSKTSDIAVVSLYFTILYDVYNWLWYETNVKIYVC